jgi:hypothetical protein
MRSPPPCVVFVARTHAIVGGAILVSIGLLHVLTRRLPQIEFGATAYILTGGLAALYLGAATLVWFGLRPGPLLSRFCALLYLPRPSFGSPVWKTMNRDDFKAHFRR